MIKTGNWGPYLQIQYTAAKRTFPSLGLGGGKEDHHDKHLRENGRYFLCFVGPPAYRGSKKGLPARSVARARHDTRSNISSRMDLTGRRADRYIRWHLLELEEQPTRLLAQLDRRKLYGYRIHNRSPHSWLHCISSGRFGTCVVDLGACVLYPCGEGRRSFWKSHLGQQSNCSSHLTLRSTLTLAHSLALLTQRSRQLTAAG